MPHKPAVAYRGLAVVSMHRRRYRNAISYLRKAQKYDPHSPLLMIDFGNLYAKMRNYRRALRCFTNALRSTKQQETKLTALVNVWLLSEHLPTPQRNVIACALRRLLRNERMCRSLPSPLRRKILPGVR